MILRGISLAHALKGEAWSNGDVSKFPRGSVSLLTKLRVINQIKRQTLLHEETELQGQRDL